MQFGIFLAFFAYFSFSCSDGSVKALGEHMSIFEIGFFSSLFALVPTLFTKRPEDNWGNVFVPKRPVLLSIRILTGMGSSILGMYAFTHLPLAEAYALIFLAPFFVTVLSRLVLKEPIGWRRWAAVLAGLGGVLLVVRPGFREILPGHLAATGVAMCGAVSMIVLRILGPSERRITLIGSVILANLVFYSVLMIPTFTVPTLNTVPLLILCGVAAGIGNLCVVFATRLAPANRVAPAQYGQIIWATLIGAAVFGEYPDLIAVAGMALVGASGLFTFMREEKRVGWARRTPLMRIRGG
ncbi:DMT family transporter [Consotaella aegiceratis]|uniref:DMT family transporter n=1 Tax=Consotaella aegiceratis TaxID=3097961 RepID=UPI002F3EF1AE